MKAYPVSQNISGDVKTHESLSTSLFIQKTIVHAYVPLLPHDKEHKKHSQKETLPVQTGDTTGTTSMVPLLLVRALRPLVAFHEANREIGSCLLPLAPPSPLQRTLVWFGLVWWAFLLTRV